MPQALALALTLPNPNRYYSNSELLLYTREEVQAGLEARGWEDCSDLIDGTYRTGEGEDSEGGEGECAGAAERERERVAAAWANVWL